LLALLDHQTLLKVPSMMDSLAGLLATVTRTLVGLKDGTRKDEPQSIVKPTAAAPGAVADPNVTSDPDGQEVPSSSRGTHVKFLTVSLKMTELTGVEGATSVAESSSPEKPSAEEDAHTGLAIHPPLIPQPSLRLIVNILTLGECSARTFQSSLALIQHLSALSDARL
jgi:E3 ubiquitin-protein ligase HUWE1